MSQSTKPASSLADQYADNPFVSASTIQPQEPPASKPVPSHLFSHYVSESDNDSASEDSDSSDSDLPDFELLAPIRQRNKEGLGRDDTKQNEVNEAPVSHKNTEEIHLDLDEDMGASTSASRSTRPDSSFASFLDSNPMGDSIRNMLLKMNYDIKNPTNLGKRRRDDALINPLSVKRNHKTGVALVEDDRDKKSKGHAPATEVRGVPVDKTLHFEEDDEEGRIPHVRSSKKRQYFQKEQLAMETPWKKKRWTKRKVQFTTAEESTPTSASSFVDLHGEVIDLTAAESPTPVTTQKQSSTLFPEFHYNLNHLLDSCEVEIHTLQNKIACEKAKQTTWLQNQTLIKKQIADSDSIISSFQAVLRIMDDAHARLPTQLAADISTTTNGVTQDSSTPLNTTTTASTKSNSPLTLQEWTETFSRILYSYPDISNRFPLHKSGVAIALPLFKELFATWDPFECEPTITTTDADQQHLDEMQRRYAVTLERLQTIKKWKSLLATHEEEYSSLLHDVIMDRIRAAFLLWRPNHNVERAATFVDTWKSLLPPKMLEHILKQLVLPRIIKYVEEWDPSEEPIHLVLFPWLPHLSDSFQSYGLYSVVNHRIVNVLRNWDPSDDSAHTIILPWKGVLQPKEMHNLISVGILPHLRKHLTKTNLALDADPQVNILEDVLLWKDLIPAPVLLQLLERSFFSRLLKAVFEWLTVAPGPDRVDHDRLSQWVTKWKNVFPENMRLDPFVMKQFQSLQQMLSESKSKEKVTPFHLTAGKSQVTDANTEAKQQDTAKFVPHRLSFKELLQRYCAKHHMSFHPLLNQQYQGHQLYSFGPIPCFIEAQCLWIQQSRAAHETGDVTEWFPVTLKEIMELAERENGVKQ